MRGIDRAVAVQVAGEVVEPEQGGRIDPDEDRGVGLDVTGWRMLFVLNTAHCRVTCGGGAVGSSRTLGALGVGINHAADPVGGSRTVAVAMASRGDCFAVDRSGQLRAGAALPAPAFQPVSAARKHNQRIGPPLMRSPRITSADLKRHGPVNIIDVTG